MSSTEESPAQRAARLRRERREAKIREGGAARLDKITSLSGRPPQSTREEVLSSPSSPQPSVPVSVPETTTQRRTQLPPQPAPFVQPALPIQPAPNVENPSPEEFQAQQDFIRGLLRQSGTPQPGQDLEEDPTMKMLNSLMAGMAGGEQGIPGGGGAGGAGGTGDAGLGFSKADIISALGLPSFVSDLIDAATRQKTEEEKKEIWLWKVLHVIFSIALGIYLLMLIGTSVTTYGRQPPPPATARNPFLFFTTGELLLSGARVTRKRDASGVARLGLWFQIFRDVVHDGSIVLFILGIGSWWNREWTAY